MTSGLPARAQLGLLLSLCGVGCAVDATGEASEEVLQSTHAIVQIQRHESVGDDGLALGGASGQGDARGDALATFVRMNSDDDASVILSVAGLRTALPPVGQCDFSLTGELQVDGELGEVLADAVELVPADGVQLSSEAGEDTLVPHAFPGVSDWIRGVVYTSRDSAGGTLAANSTFDIVIDNVDGLGSVTASHQSPELPIEVSINGQALEEVSTLPLGLDLGLTWEPSRSLRDTITVTLQSADARYSCSFDDAAGGGTLPLSELAEAGILGPGELSIHRVREAISSTSTDAPLEVRFDFSRGRAISFE